MDTKLTFDLLPVVAVVISILTSVIPKYNEWFKSMVSEKQQLFMVGVIALVGVGAAVLSYFGFVDVYSNCVDWMCWVWYPLVDIGIAVIANAGTYTGTKYMLKG
jgi:hypothetical protein